MSEFSINANNFPKVGGFESFSKVEKKFQDITGPSPGSGPATETNKEFSSLLQKTLGGIEASQKESDKAISDLATGKNKNIHQVMMTVEKADMDLKLGMQIRNKIIDAYKEVMRMQV